MDKSTMRVVRLDDLTECRYCGRPIRWSCEECIRGRADILEEEGFGRVRPAVRELWDVSAPVILVALRAVRRFRL